MFEFFRKCLANEKVRRGTIKTIIVDQLPNLMYLWQLCACHLAPFDQRYLLLHWTAPTSLLLRPACHAVTHA